MLDMVKAEISKPTEPFYQLFQRYVMNIQDSLIENDVEFISKNINKIEDTALVEKAISLISEEQV